MAISKEVAPNPVLAGEIVTYTIVIQNNGTNDAENVVLNDSISTEITDVEFSIDNGLSWSNWTTPYNIGTVLIDQTVTILIRGKVKSDTTVTSIDNTATVTSTTVDSILENDTSSISVAVDTSADISIVKIAKSEFVIVGNILTYSINVNNAGPSVAREVNLIDEMASCLTNQEFSIDNGASYNPWVSPYILGDLASGDTKTILIRGLVSSQCADPLSNTASITTQTSDPDETNNTSTIQTKVYNPSVLLEKSANKEYSAVGEFVEYTIVATNNGNVNLGTQTKPVNVFDLLNSSLEFLTASVTVDDVAVESANITSGINIGSLNVGESKVIKFKAKVISNVNNPITNISKVTFGYKVGEEEEIGSNVSNEVSIIVKVADIEITKSADKNIVALNGLINYTVVLKNTGDIDALNVIFKDSMPETVEIINGSFSINGVVVNNVNIRNGVNIGNIAVGKEVIIKYTVKVVKITCELEIVNYASAKFDYRLPDGRVSEKQTIVTEKSTAKVNVNISNFKQISIESNLCIPIQKPDMEEIATLKGDLKITNYSVIKTPILESEEGQNLTGYKLVIHGFIQEVLEYTALNEEQSVHSAHFSIPFTTFIILEKDFNTCKKIDIKGVIEDMYFKMIDGRCFFTNATVLIKAII